MPEVWSFTFGRVRVALELTQEQGYQYDGCDPDGETQAALDSGEFVAFSSAVSVSVDGEELATDYLGGSVYEFGKESEFWTAHRDRNPMNRNCSAMREARGDNVVICHYFPGMVAEAIGEAREALKARALADATH